jgi:hypothetical protein
MAPSGVLRSEELKSSLCSVRSKLLGFTSHTLTPLQSKMTLAQLKSTRSIGGRRIAVPKVRSHDWKMFASLSFFVTLRGGYTSFVPGGSP